MALTLELNKFKHPEKEAKLLLDRFKLSHRFNNLPNQLSGGEQQRVAIARAIAMKPELILADEPTGNLDTENSLMISEILFNYVKEEGSSLIMVTHDPKLANKAKRKIKINDGKLNNQSEVNLIFRYALKDLSRNYKKLSSIIVTLFISLFILSAIFTIEDSLKKELNDNAKALLGGDLEIDYNRNKGNLELIDKVKGLQQFLK